MSYSSLITLSVLTKVKRLRERLEGENNPNRRKQLIRHINFLLDEENYRLTALIHETLVRIENLLIARLDGESANAFLLTQCNIHYFILSIAVHGNEGLLFSHSH